jgi:glycosyltransferase involved in cell wall biosynthesis
MITQIPLWSMGERIGGPALMQTLTGLARHGHEVDLVCPALPYVDQDALGPGVRLHTFRHRFHGTMHDVRKVAWVFDTLGWLDFKRRAYRVALPLAPGADVIYGYEIYGVPVARRIADRFRRPMVARFQGTLMSHWMRARFAAIRFRKHLQALATPANLVIMTNDGTMGDVVLERLGVDTRRVRFWLNGAPSEPPLPGDVRARLGLPEDAPLAATVSRLDGWKRVDRIIDAWPIVRARVPDAVLAVAGTGSLDAALARRAAATGEGDSIRFLGGLEHSDAQRLIAAADVFVSLYDYSNVANPVLEAMVAGTAPIVLDSVGTGTVMHDGVNARLLPSGDRQTVGAAVAELLAAPAAARRLGRSARDWAQENLWTWDERMDAEVRELERLVWGPGHHSGQAAAQAAPGGGDGHDGAAGGPG